MPDISLKITALYAGLNALIMLTLAVLVVRARARAGSDLGHHSAVGDDALERMGWAHANNTEYVPTALILIGILELAQQPALYLHALGGMLTVGRLAHAYGMSVSRGQSTGRTIGVLLTWATFIAGALGCIWYAVN